jgi:hypothetical protein
MSTFGFSIFDEFLPSFDKFGSIEKQRIMFLRFYNMKVCSKEQFTLKELSYTKTETIFSIFRAKIYSLLPKKFNSSKKFKIDTYKTNIINNFINKAQKNISYLKLNEKTNLDLVVKIIENFEGEDFKIFLNGEDVFHKFVGKRIKDFKPDRKVKILQNEITIYPKGRGATKVYPYWKFLDKDNIQGITSHVNRAINCIKSDECRQVYLVYPRHENFDKHISIRVKELDTSGDYMIKLIPYSLGSILK